MAVWRPDSGLVRVVVELELGSDPIRGRIGDPAVDFEGWLALARILEQARGGGTPDGRSTTEEVER